MNAPVEPVNGHHGHDLSRGTQRQRPTFDRRKLPWDESIEASIIGGILLQPSVLAILTDVETDTFCDMRHRVIFDAIRNLEAAGSPIDLVTVEHEIEKTGKLEAVGGIAYLGLLAMKVPTLENVRHYADTAITLQRNRSTIIALGSALERALNWPHDPNELTAELAGELQRHLEIDGERPGDARKARWCLPLETFLGSEEPDDDDAEDWIIRDLIPRAEPVLWGGPMKGGKTWSALDLCIAMALGEDWVGFENTMKEPIRVMGMFLEDSKRRIGKRIWELCRGRMTDHGMMTPYHDRVRENLRLTRTPIRLPDPKDVRRFVAEIKAWGAKCVVIDNLTRVMIGDPNSTRDASAFTRAWVDIAEETGAAIMLLHHTKKPAGNNAGEVDPFDTLRGSGDFGAAARNVIVVSPIRQDDGPPLAELRIRGNLDLRRDGFVLGFDRDQLLGKSRVRLVNRGEIGSVKEDVRKAKKEKRLEEKKIDVKKQFAMRQELAMSLVRAEGSISQTRLANALGLGSGRSTADILNELVRVGELRRDKLRGYLLAQDPTEVSRQEGLL